jgi:hypothetical protein
MRAGEWSGAGRQRVVIRVIRVGRTLLATLIRVMAIRPMDIRVLQLVSMGGGRDTTADIMADIAVGITADTDTIANRCGAPCGQMHFGLNTANGFLLPGIMTAR